MGLHPSIPHETGLEALREVLDKREQHTIPSSELIRMANFVLKYLEFKGQIKHNISGIAIGTKFASPYACFFMDKIGTAFLETQELQPLAWFRYIDDIIFFLLSKNFLRSLNEFHTEIKFTYESSNESSAFLDLKVCVKNSKIVTDLHAKSNDCYQYLYYLTAHPNHTKGFSVCNQMLRISRLCYYEENFIKHKPNMKSWFLKREY